MSIYGPKLRLPNIRLPRPNLNIKLPKPAPKTIGIILIIILIIATIIFSFSIPLGPINFGGPISVSWVNNPLDLRESTSNYAQLDLTLINNTTQTKNITLTVTTESNEILIFCDDSTFPNVAPNAQRKTKCIVRRNPNVKIFSGTYTLNVITNLGSSKTVLEVRTT